MDDTDITGSPNRWGALIEMHPQQLFQVAVLGIGVGVAFWLLMQFLRHVIMVPLFCDDPTSGPCMSTVGISGGAATVLASMIALLGLVRLSVFRPLLVVLAVAISLWGLGDWINGQHWYFALLWCAALYAICYAAFSWLVRPRAFAPALIIVVLLVVVARWFSVL